MSSQTNSFLTRPLGRFYARTALPIIFVMGMNGRFDVIDALSLVQISGANVMADLTPVGEVRA